MGTYIRAPVEVVRCETVDLDVPAKVEIVVEGYSSTTETPEEGPVGESPGYLSLGFQSVGRKRQSLAQKIAQASRALPQRNVRERSSVG